MGRWALAGFLVAVALVAAGCSGASDVSPAAATDAVGAPRTGRVRVVAAEDTWGSLARQVGGDQADVTSIVTNPDTDPHDYDATPQDVAAIARADLVIVSGLGYDDWASKAIDANPNPQRIVLDVGALVGLHDGDNPHQWYSPSAVTATIDEIARDLQQLDPAHAPEVGRQAQQFETVGLAGYHQAIADIHAAYAGTPVGASESIFVPLAAALGVDLTTPASFLDAMSEGQDPTAGDKSTVDESIRDKTIKVFVYNSQNATPDVTALRDAAAAQGIPTPSVTETLSPEGATFQDWQTRQLLDLRQALARGTGR